MWQALRCLAEMVSDSLAAKDVLMSAVVAVQGAQQPALQAALQGALYGRVPAEREAAEPVIAAFCSGNVDGQMMLASTMMPAGSPDDPGAAGTAQYPHLLLMLTDFQFMQRTRHGSPVCLWKAQC